MNYLDLINKLLIFIGWWVIYPQFFKGNLEKTYYYFYKVLFSNIVISIFFL